MSLAFYCSNISATLGTWTSKADLPNERSTHVAFSINGVGYICGGGDDSQNFNDLWAYDQNSNTWSQRKSFPGQGRQELSAFVIGNYAYVGLGRNVISGVCFKSFYRYDASNDSWTQIADCPVMRYAAGSFSIGSNGYITCGIIPDGSRYDDLYEYNPSSNTWSQKASLPTLLGGRAFPCTVGSNGKGYLMGGFTGLVIYNDLWEYDPNTNQWTFLTICPLGQRSYSLGFALSGKVFFGMGRSPQTQNNQDWLCYNPTNYSWDSVANYPQDNTIGGACFTINSKVYVCGGFNVDGTILKYTNELSDPSLGLKGQLQNNNLKPYFAQDSKQIHCNASDGKFEFVLTDVNGKIILSKTIDADKLNEIQFDLSAVERGLYIAFFSQVDGFKTIKLLIQ